ncbi:YfiR family protein [Vibrio diazotrophicus]|uniref:YfiR family protein n=1 Tax=Vibrio diazotrophicus TaxID=685 RepID=UPI0005A8F1C5|nr:YfiR family protein [Vibrio diazotrophicus]MCZ4373107.1 YfiR family protein [Vibrio diazotrophicus]
MSFNLHRAWVLMLMLFSSVSYAAYDPTDIKAVYIFRISNFIHWNSESEMTNIEFCIVGNDKIASTLEKITQDKTVRQLPLSVTPFYREQCDILFVDAKSELNLADVLPHTVVISDNQSIGSRGGTIELATLEGKVKPKIYMANIGAYSISSSLLRIAIIEDGEKI